MIFVIGLAFNAGKHSSKIEHLEEWRDEFREEIKTQFSEVHGHMLRFEDLLNHTRASRTS